MRVAVAASALALLVGSGCAPIWGTYTRIEVPDAKYFGRSCGGSVGPKSVAYFPYHGIFLSIDIDSSIRFGINVPSGMTAELLGRTIHISGRTESGPIEFKATMVPTTTTGIFGSVHRPEYMPFFTRGYRDPAANSFGPFKGETSKENRLRGRGSFGEPPHGPRHQHAVPRRALGAPGGVGESGVNILLLEVWVRWLAG